MYIKQQNYMSKAYNNDTSHHNNTKPTFYATRSQLSLQFNCHFPGGPVFASTRTSPFWILLELRMMEMAVTTGAIRC